SSLQVAKFHRAHQRGEVSAERAQGGAILGSRVERRDQEDRGASKRRGYCLREDRQSTCRFGCAHRIGLHRVSSLVERADFALRKCHARLACETSPASLPSAAPLDRPHSATQVSYFEGSNLVGTSQSGILVRSEAPTKTWDRLMRLGLCQAGPESPAMHDYLFAALRRIKRR